MAKGNIKHAYYVTLIFDWGISTEESHPPWWFWPVAG
jgi:hypothetical protein